MDKKRLLKLAGIPLNEAAQSSDEELAREILHEILENIDDRWDPDDAWSRVHGMGDEEISFAQYKANRVQDLYRTPGSWMKHSYVMQDAVNAYRKKLRVIVKQLVKEELKTIRREKVARKRQRER